MARKQSEQDISEEDKKRIISVTMSQSLVSRIDDLVQDRIGRSRAQLIEDAVRWFIDLTVYKWSERGIYIDSSRVVLESETLSSLYFSKLTPADQYELGVTAGAQTPVADVVRLFYEKEPQNPKNYQLVLRILQDQGWGAISLHDDLIVIGSPFYPAPFIRGYLESLLKIKLERVTTSTKDTVALRIK
ncbi:MAG: ribbon-helix-helix domain-containing protein [Candidatus Thorarchaeota archaeon]